MKINLRKDLLEKLQAFASSKEKVRKYLEGINFHKDGDFLEICATDGTALLLYRRKLEEGETLPEGGGIILLMPSKIDRAARLLTIEQETDGGLVTIKGNNGFAGLCQQIRATFPNYKLLTEGWEKLPDASQFVIFSSKNMKRLEKSLEEHRAPMPKAKDRVSPHFWYFEDTQDAQYLAVLMPMRSL